MNQRERMYHLRSCFEGRRGEGNNLNERVQTDQAGGRQQVSLMERERKKRKRKEKEGRSFLETRGASRVW